MNDRYKLIIDGNAVYEIDMDCKSQAEKSIRSISIQEYNYNKNLFKLFILLYFMG